MGDASRVLPTITSVVPAGDAHSAPEAFTSRFYRLLCREVRAGNPMLSPAEQRLMRTFYGRITDRRRSVNDLAASIYVDRRTPAVEAVARRRDAVVFDGGCGFGTESFLLAAADATVVALDRSATCIEVAQKRRRWFEQELHRELDVRFAVGDLDQLPFSRVSFDLTWLASTLAAVRDQGNFFRHLYSATRQGGIVMVTDMSLWNPLFVASEWRRRRRAASEVPSFAEAADFWAMFRRRGRQGARYFAASSCEPFDDVQFFTPRSIAALLVGTGFHLGIRRFSGFLAPAVAGRVAAMAEPALARTPGLRAFGYFYLVSGVKDACRPT